MKYYVYWYDDDSESHGFNEFPDEASTEKFLNSTHFTNVRVVCGVLCTLVKEEVVIKWRIS